ncbi:hypothetical protein GCM10010389_46350 [Streptomyces echinoruber]|uniref:Uncharacterized protein n=1 Tax=Streptomyces echinoruber TaxID=68898 RepID=A0A918RLG3_9ACTN|nr:hypothetical protein GCM10010389_46350 [Streptomyces echinoruber]
MDSQIPWAVLERPSRRADPEDRRRDGLWPVHTGCVRIAQAQAGHPVLNEAFRSQNERRTTRPARWENRKLPAWRGFAVARGEGSADREAG